MNFYTAVTCGTTLNQDDNYYKLGVPSHQQGGFIVLSEVQQLDCPVGDGYTTNAETQEGAAARLVDHYVDKHPGNLPPLIVNLIKGLTGHFK